MIWNQSPLPLILHTVDGTFDYILPARCRALIHFQETISHRVLQLCRPLPGWAFSGRFSINHEQSMSVKTCNERQGTQLEVTVSTLHTAPFLLTTVNTQKASPFVIVRNYCPFAVDISQKADLYHCHRLPGYSSLDFTLFEPLMDTDIAIRLPTVRLPLFDLGGVEVTEELVTLKVREGKAIRLPTRVPRKAELLKSTTVQICVGNTEVKRSARLGDGVLLLVKKATTAERLRKKQSAVTLALPLHDCLVTYHGESIPYHIRSLAFDLVPLLPPAFTLLQFNQALEKKDPTLSSQLFSTLRQLGLLQEHASKKGYFVFNCALLRQFCMVTVDNHSSRVDLIFENPEKAKEWEKLMRFEASTVHQEFPRENWLNVSGSKIRIQDVLSMSFLLLVRILFINLLIY